MSQSGNSDDEVRKSIDVLDRVLSEFDDVESPFLQEDPTGQKSSFTRHHHQQEEEDHVVSLHHPPPPVDRGLKPRWSPPSSVHPQRHRSDHHSRSNKHGQEFGHVPKEESVCFKAPQELSHDFSLSQRSQCSRRSEGSSHVYQEINSDFLQENEICQNHLDSPGKVRNHPVSNGRSNNQHFCNRTRREMVMGGSQDIIPGSVGCPPQYSPRRCTSGDIPVLVSNPRGGREKKNGPNGPQQKRGRSSERILDPRPHYVVDPRRFSEPRLIDPRLIIDPHVVDGRRFEDPRMLDHRFRDHPRFYGNPDIDPRMVDFGLHDPRFVDPMFTNDHNLPLDFHGNPYPFENQLNFPHLMPSTLYPQVNYTLPQTVGFDYQPQGPYPYQYPLFPSQIDPILTSPPNHPDCLIDCPGGHQGMNTAPMNNNNFGPGFLLGSSRQCGTYPVDYPLDFPLNYPHDWPPLRLHPRERLSLDGGGRSFFNSKDPRLCRDRGWFPKTQEEARMMMLNNPQRDKTTANKNESENFSPILPDHHPNDCKLIALHQNSPSRQKHNFKPAKTEETNEKHQLQVKQFHDHDFDVDNDELIHRENFNNNGEFNGGKDSGFDEENNPSSPNSDVHFKSDGTIKKGSFVVAGVFTDSSNMYIPAPPSPVPDYDNERFYSGDEDEDIPHEPFYISSKSKFDRQDVVVSTSSSCFPQERKVSSSSGGSKASSGLSNDSLKNSSRNGLQTSSVSSSPVRNSTPYNKNIAAPDTRKKSCSTESNSLLAMIDKFHEGLPTSAYDEVAFSDDSLEDDLSSSASPMPHSSSSRMNNSGGYCHERQASCESLISMESSTTSFDYVTEFNGQYQINQNLPNRNFFPQESSSDLPRKVYCGSDNNNKSVKVDNTVETVHDVVPDKKKMNDSKQKEIPRFDTVKNLMKEGLLEGLDEVPPDFVPLPPSKKSINQMLCQQTNKEIERRSQKPEYNIKDKTNPSSNVSKVQNMSPSANQVPERRPNSPPPLPPLRDTSLTPQPTQLSAKTPSQTDLSRNQSWLYKDRGNLKLRTATGETAFRNESQAPPVSIHNSSLSDIHSRQDDPNERNMSQHLKNRKNLQHAVDSSTEHPSLQEDQVNPVSQGSRGQSRPGPGRFLSKFSESVKSSSRSNSPSNTCQKSSKKSLVSTKVHADFIRVPTNHKKEAPQPPKFGHHRKVTETNSAQMSSVSPTTFSDVSTKFRSVENLTTEAPISSKSLDFKKPLINAGKKTSTLPVTASPADMRKMNTSDLDGLHCRDELTRPKFKFGVFKGFWRRNKYSFEKS